MARTKQNKGNQRQLLKRTSWTRFYLTCGQDWPTWSEGYADVHRGPLTGVTGCQTVWLGRTVDDPEQAALIILWESAESLKNFQSSPACDEFLKALPEHKTQVSVLSGALLRGLSLEDPVGASAPSSSSRFPSFRWDYHYRFEEHLQAA
ncbi:hypothetical protein GGR54DRAFT_644187 [Hypoxylon sp. NC1633]|nr:hypothetical protein GGR54DRAFT_644187 [Hypoxylon sp. NC1633]